MVRSKAQPNRLGQAPHSEGGERELEQGQAPALPVVSGSQEAEGGTVPSGNTAASSMEPLGPQPAAKPATSTRRSHILEEVRNYQSTTDLLIPRVSFQRFVREICRDVVKQLQEDYQTDEVAASSARAQLATAPTTRRSARKSEAASEEPDAKRSRVSADEGGTPGQGQEIQAHRSLFNGRVAFESQALLALQEAAEQFLVGVFEDCTYAAVHGRRVTIMPRDVALIKRLRGSNGFDY